MSAHTQRPWLIDVRRERQFVQHVIRSADNTEIAKLVSPPDDAVAEHNARLIAAAPDMLEALKIALGELEGPDGWHVSRDVVSAAIAKATGGDQ